MYPLMARPKPDGEGDCVDCRCTKALKLIPIRARREVIARLNESLRPGRSLGQGNLDRSAQDFHRPVEQ
jgi:hypothetical protein